jgi:hypothetical protein
MEVGELLSLVRELRLAPDARLDALLEHNLNSRRLLVGLLKLRRPLS